MFPQVPVAREHSEPVHGSVRSEPFSRGFRLTSPSLQRTGRTMTYHDIPLIIPILATGYLLTIYVLLSFAQRNARV